MSEKQLEKDIKGKGKKPAGGGAKAPAKAEAVTPAKPDAKKAIAKDAVLETSVGDKSKLPKDATPAKKTANKATAKAEVVAPVVATKPKGKKQPAAVAQADTGVTYSVPVIAEPFISIKNLTKTYINSKEERVVALNDVSLEFPKTGFVYLKGESGSGKSTLLNILGGLDRFDSGQLIVDGENFAEFSASQLDDWRADHAAFVFQDFNLLHEYSVAENIKLGANFAGSDITDEQVSEVLQKVGLSGFENRKTSQLSGGEHQRVSIARALVKTPKVLLVDEPTGQINIENAEKVFSILKDISKDILVVCVSYDADVIKKYIDRDIKLLNGAVVKNVVVERTAKQSVQIQASGLRNEEKKEKFAKTKHAQHIFKIGLRNITGRKISTIFLVLLTSFSLLFGSVFYMLSGYNRYEALAQSLNIENLKYATFESKTVNVSTIYTQLYSHNEGYSVYRLNAFKASNLVSGIIELTAPANNTVGARNVFGQKILHGEYPKFTVNPRSIVITDFLANRLVNPDAEISMLIGHTIEVAAGINLKVSGIVETDFRSVDANSATYAYNLENIYSVIHVAPGFVDNFAEQALGLEMYVGASDVYFGGTQAYTLNRFNQVYTDILPLTQEGVPSSGVMPISVPNGAVIVSKAIYGAKNVENTITLKANGVVKQYSIAGVLDTDHKIVLFSETDFVKDVLREVMFPASKLVLNITDSDAINLGAVISNLENNYDATLKSSASDEINEFSTKIEIFKTAILVFTIVSTALTIALFYNFITLSIVNNKKNIGVLRSIGANSMNIAGIFFITVGLISTACVILTSTLSVISALVINAVVASSMQIPFHIIIFNPVLLGLIALLCFGVGFVATVSPIVRYSFQPPIKQISKR